MRNILVDTDPGCDDAVMLAFLLAHEDVNVVGITTVAGNTTVDNTTKNAVSILELFDRTDIPVARGCHRPLIDELEVAEWVHGEGGLRGELPEPETKPVETHATEFIIEQAHTYDDLTIAAVGPQTNLATALAIEPELPDLAGEIYQMGGAAMVTGNTTPMAEFNFYNDPEAASRVVQEATPRMVGLDSTRAASVATATIDEFRDAGGRLSTVASWLEYPSELVRNDMISIHDAAVGVDIVESVLSFEDYYVDIDTSYGPSRGAVICDEHDALDEPDTAQVAVDIDTERYQQTLLNTLWSLQ